MVYYLLKYGRDETKREVGRAAKGGRGSEKPSIL